MKDKRAKTRIETLVSAGGVVYRRVNGVLQAVLCGRYVNPKPSSGSESPDPSTEKRPLELG